MSSHICPWQVCIWNLLFYDFLQFTIKSGYFSVFYLPTLNFACFSRLEIGLCNAPMKKLTSPLHPALKKMWGSSFMQERVQGDSIKFWNEIGLNQTKSGWFNKALSWFKHSRVGSKSKAQTGAMARLAGSGNWLWAQEDWWTLFATQPDVTCMHGWQWWLPWRWPA